MADAHTAGGCCGRWLAAIVVAGAMVVPARASDSTDPRKGSRPAIDPVTSAVDLDAVTAVSAEVTVRHSRLDAGGVLIGGVAPAVGYRIDRRRVGGRWETVMQLVHGGTASLRVPSGTVPIDAGRSIARIEDRGDGSPARAFDLRGVEVKLPATEQVRSLLSGEPDAIRRLGLPSDASTGPAPAPTAGTGAADGVRGLIASAKGRAARRAAMHRSLGPPAGRRGGLDVHVERADGEVRETLVDPVTMVPVETSVTRENRRVEHARFSYATGVAGDLVRTGLRSERLLPFGDGQRLVVEVEFSDVRVATGGAR